MRNAAFNYLLILSCLLSFPYFAVNAQVLRPAGTNLTSISDWSEEFVFVDVFKQSREWIAHEYGSGVPWSSSVSVPLDANGYPLEIPYDNGTDPPQAIRTLMYFGSLEGLYPSGNYRLIVSGTGQVRLWGAASATFSCQVDTLVFVDNSLGGIAFERDTSLASDHIRDIHFVMPDFHNTFADNPFHPNLLDFIDDFQVIRFMDWMRTNGSDNIIWSDRNTPSYYAQTLLNGVAYEHIIELSNLTQKDAWICVPHQADDHFITQLAILMRDSLDPNLKVYVEYSNEVWNGSFSQNHYAADMGDTLGYPGQAWERTWQYYSKRSADVFTLFDAQFAGSPGRLVKVLASQAANSWVSNYIIDHFKDSVYNPSQVQADAIAIAPYFGGSVANDIGDAGQMNMVSVSDILDSMEMAMPISFDWMNANKIVADTHNLDLIAYEGGQHLVAGWAYNNDTAFVAKLLNANRNSRMQDMYCDYFNYWYDSTDVGLFCSFSSHGNYSKWGAWGLKEYYEDTLAPKYLGLKNCVFSYNSDTTVIADFDLQSHSDLMTDVFPVPSEGRVSVRHNLTQPSVALYDFSGKEIFFQILSADSDELSIHVPDFSGPALLLLQDSKKIVSRKLVFIQP